MEMLLTVQNFISDASGSDVMRPFMYMLSYPFR